MKHIILTLLILCLSGVSYAQKSIDKYIYYSEFETHEANEYLVTNLFQDFVLKQKIHREKRCEYFEMEDTAYRTYLQVADKAIMVDSLVIKNYDQYSMDFQVQSLYHIIHQTDSFVVIRAFDAYQYGTETQGIFIVFQLTEGRYFLHSVYVVMDPEKFRNKKELVKVCFPNNDLQLKGASLVKLRSPNWIR